MIFFLYSLAWVLLPIWFLLIILKLFRIRFVCQWKFLLIPVWILLAILLVYLILAVGFSVIVFGLHIISK